MQRLFQDGFIFGEATSSHFFKVTTSAQQLFFRSSYFFRAATILRSSFFKTITFSQQLFFQNSYFYRAKLLPSSHFLRKSNSLWQLLCRNSYFFVEELVQNKDINSRATFSKQVLLHSINLFRTDTFSTKVLLQKRRYFFRTAILEKANFSEKQYSVVPTFSGGLLYQRAATF